MAKTLSMNKMNIMRKILCMIISLMIMISALPGYAADQSMLSAGSDSKYKGEKVKINITLDKPQGIRGIRFYIKYDKNILSVSDADIKKESGMENWNFEKEAHDLGEIRINAVRSSGYDNTSPITICSIGFTISSSAAAGDTTIIMDSIIGADKDGNGISLTSSNGKVEVLNNTLPANNPGSSGGSSGQTTSSNPVQGTTVTVTPTTDTSGTAAAAVTPEQIAGLLSNMTTGASGNNQSIEIHVPVDTTAKQVNLTLPRAAFSSINNSGANEVTISTGIGNVSFDKSAIAAINDGGTGDISLSIGKVDTATLPADVRNAIGNHPVYSFTVKSGSTVLSSFNGGSATVEVPYANIPGEERNAVVVYYIDADGRLSTVSLSNPDTANGRVTFVTTHFSKYAVGYNKVSFTDTQNHWSSSNITYLAARNIVSGIGNGKFVPDNGITRAAFTKMLAGILDVNVSSYTNSKFSDVQTDAWYFPYVSWAAANGIASGSGGKFNPNDPITREQMALMITKFAITAKYKLPAAVTASSFADKNKISSWAENAVNTVQAAGIISGKPGNIFDPQAGATRAEAARMLATLMKDMAQ